MTSSELHQCVAVIHVRMFTLSMTLQTSKYIYCKKSCICSQFRVKPIFEKFFIIIYNTKRLLVRRLTDNKAYVKLKNKSTGLGQGVY